MPPRSGGAAGCSAAARSGALFPHPGDDLVSWAGTAAVDPAAGLGRPVHAKEEDQHSWGPQETYHTFLSAEE